MGVVIEFLSSTLSVILKACYQLTGNYGISIIIFTLITKFILFPVNIFIQKNSIKMVKMQPQLDALKIKYIDDKDKLIDEQQALYKKNHYHSSVSIIPLIFQLALVMGLLDVIYKPLTYLLKVGAADSGTSGSGGSWENSADSGDSSDPEWADIAGRTYGRTGICDQFL